MRTSEALIIGSLQLRPKPYTVDDGNGYGCAIGMINRANGRVSVDWRGEDVEWMNGLTVLPCNCKSVSNVWTLCSAMVHLFNEHVCKDIFSNHRMGRDIGYTCDIGEDYTMADSWTLEQLADWLESVDPTPKETPEEKHEAVEMYCESLVKQ